MPAPPLYSVRVSLKFYRVPGTHCFQKSWVPLQIFRVPIICWPIISGYKNVSNKIGLNRPEYNKTDADVKLVALFSLSFQMYVILGLI